MSVSHRACYCVWCVVGLGTVVLLEGTRTVDVTKTIVLWRWWVLFTVSVSSYRVCSCVFVVCGRMCVDRLSPCPDPGLSPRWRNPCSVRGSARGLLSSERVVTVFFARFTTVQLCTSVPLFLIFFGVSRRPSPVSVLHHTGI